MAERTTDSMPEKISDEAHLVFLRTLEEARSNSQVSAQNCGAILANYDKNGGNKKALSLVVTLRKMGDEKAEAFLRAFDHLVDILGMRPEPDLVDVMQAEAKKPPPASRKAPREGKPPVQKGRAVRLASLTEKRLAKEAEIAAKQLAAPASGHMN